MNKLEKFLKREGEASQATQAPDAFEETVYRASQQVKAPTPIWKKKPVLIAVAACLVVALVSLLPQGEFKGLVTIEARAATIDGIDRSQGFLLKSSEPLDESLIAESLTVSPSFDYEIEKTSKKTYEIIPKDPLDANTVYVLKFNQAGAKSAANSWAFETTEGFELTASYPYNEANNVNIYSGLELTFSTSCPLDTLKDSVTIEPALEGIWETGDNLLFTYVPSQEMAYGTIYQITIPGDLTGDNDSILGEDVILQFETTSLEGEQASTAVEFFAIEGLDNTAYAPGKAPFFSFYDYGRNNDAVFDIETRVYGFPSIEAYTSALHQKTGDRAWSIAPSETILDTDDLTPVTEATITPYVDPQQPWYRTLYLPDVLEPGFYLIDFQSADCRRQVLIQVTSLSVFQNYSQEEALLWIHDVNTDNAVVGAEIQSVLDKSIQTKTDAEGVAQVEYIGKNKEIFQVKKGDQEAVVLIRPVTYFMEDGTSKQYDYWLAFNTDRTIYHNGDTVKFFGIVAPREEGAEPIDRIVISSDMLGDSFTVPVTNGWFSGSYTLPVMASGNWCTLSVSTPEGEHLAYYGFEVREYDKPAYRLSLRAENKYVMLNELAEFEINTSYFDETALPKQDLYYYTYNLGSQTKEGNITTDENGNATLSLRTVPTEYSNKSLTGYASMDVYTTWPELGRVDSYHDIIVFNTDVEINGITSRTNEGVDITFQPYGVDLAQITEEDPENYKAPFTGSVDLKLVYYKQWWEEVQDGTRYDPYLKQNVPYYRYEYHKDYEGETTVSLNQEKQVVSIPLAETNSYLIEVSGKDSKGREFIREYYAAALEKDTVSFGGEYPYYYLKSNQDNYQFGDSVQLELMERELAVDIPSDGKVLYYRAQDQLIDYTVEKSSTYEFDFLREHSPTLVVGAVYYDGGKYYPVSDAYISFDPGQRTLDLEVTPEDGTRFAPGAEVTLHVLLTDPKGDPVSGLVNLNIVDEALLAVSEQNIDLPETIFFHNNKLAYFFKETNMRESASDMMGGGAEGGEGGGARNDFRDTALFTSLETDASGKGSVTFTLPDNITSWRIFWQAYRYDSLPDIWVGSGTENVIATQPFFIDYRLATVLVKGDQPTLGLRAAGDDLDANATVTYEVTLQGKETKQEYTKTVTGNLGQWIDIPLSEVQEDGTLTVSGSVKENNKLSDSISVDIHTVSQLANHAVSDTQELTPDYLVPTEHLSQTLLLFSNDRAAKGLSGLYELAVTDTVRVEQRLTSFLAQGLLKEYFQVESFITDEKEVRGAILKYQDSQTGGIRPLPAAEVDLEVSVLTAVAGSEFFHKGALIDYFKSYLDRGTDKEKSLALWGLAATRQPYLNQAIALYEEGNLDGEGQLYLALALHAFGEGPKAQQMAEDLVKKYSEDLGGARRATISSLEEETIRATARMALLATAYELPQAQELTTYLDENPGTKDHYLIERYLILESMVEYGNTQGSFRYDFDGETTDVDLAENYTHSLVVPSEKAHLLTFQNIKGDISVTACYLAPGLPEADSAASQELSLSRQYLQNGKATTQFQQGAEIKVVLEYKVNSNAPDGPYLICDYLPAGLDYVRMDRDASGNSIWLSNEVNGKQTFSIYKGNHQDKVAPSGKIVYIARVKMPGSFHAEGAYIQHGDHQKVVHVLDSQKITIQ